MPNKKSFRKTRTKRGFNFRSFADYNGVECSIQKSSIATDDLIWLGCDKTGFQYFIPNGNPSWRSITDAELALKFGAQHIITNTRMHLTRKQVKKILPVLQKFVETGDI